MKKKILSFFLLSFLSLLYPSSTFSARQRVRVKSPTKQISGARGSAYGGASSSVKFRSDRKALLVTISNTESISSVSYQLTYQAGGVSQGVMGKIDPSIEPTATRELLFGTCSSSVCTYHTNITNARLTISSYLKGGQTIVKPYRIRI